MSGILRTQPKDSASTSNIKTSSPDSAEHYVVPDTCSKLPSGDSSNECKDGDDPTRSDNLATCPDTKRKVTRNDDHKTNNSATDTDVPNDEVHSFSMDIGRQQSDNKSTFSLEHNEDLSDGKPSLIRQHDATNNLQTPHQPEPISPLYKYCKSLNCSQTKSAPTTPNPSRRSSEINHTSHNSPGTPDTSFMVTLISPTDISAFNVPTPPTTPTPLPGKRKWTQKFTSKAESIAREVKAHLSDESWSPSDIEGSPVYHDRPIPCGLPRGCGKSKLSEDEAFDELDKAFGMLVLREWGKTNMWMRFA